MLKKVILGIVAVVVLLVGAVAATFGPVFAGIVKPTDGQEIGEPKARLVIDGYANIFVLPVGEKTVALVDCGNDPTGAAILKELTRRGLNADAVVAIFLTHGHPDHIASCHLFTKAKVYGFEGDVKQAAGEVRFKGPLPSKMDIPVEKRVKVTDLLVDGQAVQVDGLTVTPFAVPGHTAGSAAFLANGVVYLGDNAAAKNDGFVPAPWIFSDDTEENKRSLKALYGKLQANGTVKTLAPAHSAPVDGLDALKHAFEG
jgi:glyoxylase-like metal-dependent hydrolase (beta-lactamase superfamily II)